MNVGAHHPDFVVFLGQIVEQDIAHGNNTEQLLLLADGKVTKAVAAHQVAASFEVSRRFDGQGIGSHDFPDFRTPWIAALDNHAPHEIAL